MTTDLCPWLGTDQDREIRYALPSETHLCHAQQPPADIALDYQANFCLVAEHRACRFYREPDATQPPLLALEEEEDQVGPPPPRFPWLRVLLWAAALVLAIFVVYQFGSSLLTPLPTATVPAHTDQPPASTATSTVTRPPAPASPSPAYQFKDPTATPTPHPGGAIYNLAPAADAAGWVASDEARGNHLGDSYLYTGVFEGIIYHGVFQLDLSAIPRGAPIHSAQLAITGLDDRRLGDSGTWEVRILSREADEEWPRSTFQDVHNASVRWTLAPALGVDDLAVNRTNTFALSPEQLQEIEQRLLEEHYTLSFRIDGPLTGADSVFAWDTGYGSATQGAAPHLLLSVGAAPETPVPTGTPPFVVVTSTPRPANVLTAAALARTATSVATRVGPPTPTYLYEWTATPEFVVTNTPTPATQATADHLEAVATAVALTTGTFTPTPVNLKTATATPVLIPIERLTATPTPSPAPSPPALPAEMAGLILFQSNRAGGAGPWAMNTDGHEVALLTAPWPYDVAASREAFSPEGDRFVYADRLGATSALLVRSLADGQTQTILTLETGQASAPVWSPTRNQVAFVSTASGSSQIWVVNVDGSGLRQVTADEWGAATHPSFSPGGDRLAYTGIGADGRRQVWIVTLNGSARFNISNNAHDEWDPVWIK